MRGSLTNLIAKGLLVIIIGLVIIIYFLMGWEISLISILIALFVIYAMKSLAAKFASKSYSLTVNDEKSNYIGYPPQKLQKLTKKITESGWRNYDPNDELELFRYCYANPQIKKVMDAYSLGLDDFPKLYGLLIETGAGQWVFGHYVASSTLAYPEALEYFLKNKDNQPTTTARLIWYFEFGKTLE